MGMDGDVTQGGAPRLRRCADPGLWGGTTSWFAGTERGGVASKSAAVTVVPLPLSRPDRPRGLTLLELVVVLSILAVLALVAVKSLEPVADQARYEATVRTLTSIERAVLDSDKVQYGDDSASASGFVADTGRTPASLAELFVQPPNLAAVGPYAFDSDGDTVDDVRLVSGWNGPYLRLPVGVSSNNLKDGYGRDFIVTLPVAGQIVVTSQGADGNSDLPEEGYDQDLGLSITPADYLIDLSFHVYETDNPTTETGRKVAIRFYGKNAAGGTDGSIEESVLGIQAVAKDVLVDFTFPTSGSSQTVSGTVAARAVVWNDVIDNNAIDPSETIEKKSPVHYISAVPRVTRLPVDLRLRP